MKTRLMSLMIALALSGSVAHAGEPTAKPMAAPTAPPAIASCCPCLKSSQLPAAAALR